MERLFFILLLGFALFPGASIPRAAESTPVLRWAAATDSNAPYAFFGPDNHLTGFEYEIINAVAKHMGRTPKFVPNNWDGLIPGLGRGLYDCVICGIEITPDKAGEVLFSKPYYITFEQLVVRRGTPPVQSLEQLSGKKIGSLPQTAAMAMLEKTPGVVATPYDEELNAYADVVNGRISGVLLDYPIAKYYAGNNPGLEFTGPPFGHVSYGIAVARDNTALQRQIDAALDEIIADGEMRDILSRWGLWTPTIAEAFGQSARPSLPDTHIRPSWNRPRATAASGIAWSATRAIGRSC